MRTTIEIFDRYEAIRPRLPGAQTAVTMHEIDSLLDIAEADMAFVFDAFGVLNVGETLIPGADLRLNQLRAMGCAIRILTNAASYDRDGAIAKFRNLGVTVQDDEIITSRDATLAHLGPGHWGVIAASEDTLSDINTPYTRLTDVRAEYELVDGFLFLSSAEWTDTRQHLLSTSLAGQDRPVLIANADLAAPRDGGFSREPGYFGHQLADEGAQQVRFFGKPFPEVYELVSNSLTSYPPDRIVMCGDTLHTDILGAAAQGWGTVLVTQDGLFSGHATADFCDQAKINPDFALARI